MHLPGPTNVCPSFCTYVKSMSFDLGVDWSFFDVTIRRLRENVFEYRHVMFPNALSNYSVIGLLRFSSK